MIRPQWPWALVALSISGTVSAGDVFLNVDSLSQEVTLSAPGGVRNGNCTLGEAILAVNSGGQVDGCDATTSPGQRITVVLQNARYELTEPAVSLGGTEPQITAAGLPTIEADFLLLGNGATIARSAAPNTRGFNLVNFADDTLLIDLRDITLEGGIRRQGGAGAPAMLDGRADILRLENVTLQSFQGEAFDIDVTTGAVLTSVQVLGDGSGSSLGGDIAAQSDTSPTISVSDSVFSGLLFSGLDISATRSGISNADIQVTNSTFSNNFGTDGTGLDITAVAEGATILVSGCTFSNNTAATAGGGLQVDLVDSATLTASALTLENNAFKNNRAPNEGGAVRLLARQTPITLNIDDDVYRDNYARDGGALYLEGITASEALLSGLLFDGNVATNGAALFHSLTAGNSGGRSMRLTQSALIDNFAYSDGGALALAAAGEATLIDNTTFNGNQSFDDVIAFIFSDIDLVLEAVTMDNNAGNNLVDLFAPSTLTMRNVVSTANPDGFLCDPGTAPQVTDAGGNHLTTDECTGVEMGDPMLGELTDNGGSTPSQLPLPRSPLIDAGVAPVEAPESDQRGLPRSINGAPDIGAVETGAIVVFVNSFEGT